MAFRVFSSFLNKYANGNVNFTSSVYKVILVSTAPTVNQLNNWTYRSSASSIEVVSSGYTAGGINLGYAIGTLERSAIKQPIVFDNVTNGWSGLTTNVAGSIIYANVGTASTDILCCYFDFGGTIPLSSATFGWEFATPFYLAG